MIIEPAKTQVLAKIPRGFTEEAREQRIDGGALGRSRRRNATAGHAASQPNLIDRIDDGRLDVAVCERKVSMGILAVQKVEQLVLDEGAAQASANLVTRVRRINGCEGIVRRFMKSWLR